jgi:hypothetical protein
MRCAKTDSYIVSKCLLSSDRLLICGIFVAMAGRPWWATRPECSLSGFPTRKQKLSSFS